MFANLLFWDSEGQIATLSGLMAAYLVSGLIASFASGQFPTLQASSFNKRLQGWLRSKSIKSCWQWEWECSEVNLEDMLAAISVKTSQIFLLAPPGWLGQHGTAFLCNHSSKDLPSQKRMGKLRNYSQVGDSLSPFFGNFVQVWPKNWLCHTVETVGSDWENAPPPSLGTIPFQVSEWGQRVYFGAFTRTVLTWMTFYGLSLIPY